MDGYINVSGSGFECLQNFTSEIYGERGQFAHSLKRYLAGPEWHNACRVVKTVEEIPIELIKGGTVLLQEKPLNGKWKTISMPML